MPVVEEIAVADKPSLDGVDVAGWRAEFADMFARVAGRFGRVEPRLAAGEYIGGLLSGLERKNGWSLAEHAGDATPDGMQRLVNHARWDADAVRDDLRDYVVDRLGDPGGVLVADETGFVKKGTSSAGVQRQYTGTSGKIDNCQLGVFLAYASPAGRSLVDRELYLPRSWTDDRDRAAAAGVPDQVEFATKPALAQTMLARALAARVPFAWFTADEAYGQDPKLREWLEDRDIAYVLAVSRDHQLDTAVGRRRADTLAATVPGPAWSRISAGQGAKGHRVYDWALVATTSPTHQLLIRRSLASGEHAYYLCPTPAGPVSLSELVRVAGARWAVEECFQTAKNEAGLDHYQVRRYRAWYRHVTLAMLAAAYLAVTASTTPPETRPPTPTSPDEPEKGVLQVVDNAAPAGRQGG